MSWLSSSINASSSSSKSGLLVNNNRYDVAFEANYSVNIQEGFMLILSFLSDKQCYKSKTLLV